MICVGSTTLRARRTLQPWFFWEVFMRRTFTRFPFVVSLCSLAAWADSGGLSLSPAMDRATMLGLTFADLMVLPTVFGALVLCLRRRRTRMPLLPPGVAAMVVGSIGLAWSALPHQFLEDAVVTFGVANALLVLAGAVVVLRTRGPLAH
jgi:hypothetical protein